MTLQKHYVATSYVYDQETERFFLLFHRKLGKWLSPGGHLHEGEEPHQGALRELLEETGLSGRIIDVGTTLDVHMQGVAQLPAPFCILSEIIPPGEKKDKEHIHIDFVYIVAIDHSESLHLDSVEAVQAGWFSLAEIDCIETFDNVRQVCHAIHALHHMTANL